MTPAVQEVIIRPMTELYLPPLHLRGDPQAKARALDAYDKALAGFDRDTLQKGWQKVVAVQTYWVWPNPGVIAEACRQCQPRLKPTNEEEKRRNQAQDMAEAYTARYMKTSHLAKLARQEGRAGPLRKYVADAAWVQAQLICQVQNIGWNTHLADNLGKFHSSQEAFTAYQKTIAGAAERGQIRVHVPPSSARAWKEKAGNSVSLPSPATRAC